VARDHPHHLAGQPSIRQDNAAEPTIDGGNKSGSDSEDLTICTTELQANLLFGANEHMQRAAGDEPMRPVYVQITGISRNWTSVQRFWNAYRRVLS
jgi:hypothetical protein